MTTITGLLKDSSGTTLNGTLTVKLNADMPDVTAGTLYLQEPATFTITAGAINLTLQQSETTQTSYRFTFTKTGSTVPLLDFDAVVPNVASVDFSLLVPSGATTDVLDTSLQRLATILTSNAQYRQLLRGGPNPAGVWSPSTYYLEDDLVSYDGGSYVYVASISTAGHLPTETAYWQQITARGATGTGTTGNNTPFGVAWSGQTDAPSRNAIYQELLTRAKLTDLTPLAPLASPVLTGAPQAPTPSAGSNDSSIPNTNWVRSRLADYAPLNNPTFLGVPRVPTAIVTATPDTQAASLAYVSNLMKSEPVVYVRNTAANGSSLGASPATLNFQAIDIDSHNAFTSVPGTFTVPKDGLYQFVLNLALARSGGTSTAFTTVDLIFNGGPSGSRIYTSNTTADAYHYINCIGVQSLTQGTQVSLRLSFSLNGGGSIVWTTTPNLQTNFLYIRRISS